MTSPSDPSDPRRFFPPSRFGAIREIIPITLGRSSASVFSVSTETGDFILRAHGADRTTWSTMISTYSLAAEHGIAPPVVHIDAEQGALITAKITGTVLAAALARPESRPLALRSLIEQVSRLHALPTTDLPPRESFAMGRAVWQEQVQRPGFPSWATSFGERLAAIVRTVERDPRRVFSHCDLHQANVLWDGTRVWLVDWEGAGLAHPYLDIATFSNLISLPDDAALGLVTMQERGPLDDEQRALFLSMRELLSIVYGAVFLRLIPDLTSVTFASRDDTPPLAQCFVQMEAGTLDMGAPQGQATFAAAMFRQVPQ